MLVDVEDHECLSYSIVVKRYETDVFYANSTFRFNVYEHQLKIIIMTILITFEISLSSLIIIYLTSLYFGMSEIIRKLYIHMSLRIKITLIIYHIISY